MEFNRTTNAKKTIISSLIIKVVLIFIPFLMRTLVIYSLGKLYLGLGSLFTSILNALNLAELGVGSALVYAMYKPVSEDNKELINALLNVYKKTYLIIGVIVSVIGLAITPFLHFFIKGDYPADINIYAVFLIQLASIVCGYFFMAYRGSVLMAYQRMDLINYITLGIEVFSCLLQTFFLLVIRNYYLYIGVLIIKALLLNVIVSLVVHKMFPSIKAEGKIDEPVKKMVIKKTGALMGHKLGSVVINSLDNILISMFIGLEIVALYNNYFYIITALSGLFLALIGGLYSIIGNYCITKTKEEIVSLFNTIHYCFSGIVCFCCVCLLNMFQPFINLWVGEDYLLLLSSVCLFSAYFFTMRIRTAAILFKDSYGLWEKDVLKPYIQIVIDLTIDIILLNTIGINGAIISTIVCMIFAFIYEGIVLFKYCFECNPKWYFIKTVYYLLICAFSCVGSFLLCLAIADVGNNFITLLVCFAISSVTSIGVFLCFTCWMPEFKNAFKLLFNRRNSNGKSFQ